MFILPKEFKTKTNWREPSGNAKNNRAQREQISVRKDYKNWLE